VPSLLQPENNATSLPTVFAPVISPVLEALVQVIA
jgi:hypothetical protein